MSAAPATVITSRANPVVQRLRRLLRGSADDAVWIEGEHLCAALLAHGIVAQQAVLSASGWHDAALRALAASARQVVVIDDGLFDQLSPLPSPARIGCVVARPAMPEIDPTAASLVLDRVQDAGNVGSMLRSAAAFGVAQVLALRGTAALWSPKVLRAGMGAHFGLRLIDALDEAALAALRVPLVATSSHAAATLRDTPLPWPCAWVLGHEGQGVSPTLLQRCALQLRVPQPGGQESLNVAAAAAICLYASAEQAAAR